MTGKTYTADLEALHAYSDSLPNTPMFARAKIGALVLLNMRYERIMLERSLATHPYDLVRGFVRDAHQLLRQWSEVAFIEDPAAVEVSVDIAPLEEAHQRLFQDLWTRFSSVEYDSRVERYLYRLRVNSLDGGWLAGKDCIDFGCGHGNFAHALVRCGASHVLGIDFGANSIHYANMARDALGVPASRIEFEVATVYDVPAHDGQFDFAIQNGVFHHVDDEDRALREVYRVLKPGGWFWYYTDGSGGITYDLWDASREMLARVPHDFVIDELSRLGIETGKRYHLGDGLNAVYRHATWEEVTDRLARHGFGDLRRLRGGFPTDFDEEVIEADRFGEDKFGCGDIRALVRKQ